MKFPKIGNGCNSLLTRYIRLKRIPTMKPKRNKVLNVIISEVNPPMCDLVKELSCGGSRGSVPIKFASSKTMARTCPPKLCNCKKCKCLTVPEEKKNNIILYAKYFFLGQSLLLIWAVGGFGSTWDTWNLTECIQNYYYDLMGVKFMYKNKCTPQPKEDYKPICCSVWSPWNKFVFYIISKFTNGYNRLARSLRWAINYQHCDIIIEKIPIEKQKKKRRIDPKKIYRALFNELDPINVTCCYSHGAPDYFARYFEMACEENKKKEATVEIQGKIITLDPEIIQKADCILDKPKKWWMFWR